MPLQATSGAASQDAFGGNGVAVVPTYIEDVFSTFLYTGNESGGSGQTQVITNDIDLAVKGGMVWGKRRSAVSSNRIQDTVRGTGNEIFTDLTNAQNTGVSGITSFNSNGFTLGGTFNNWNASGSTYASWTFRKQPKFFDIVTYTGDGTNNRAIPHNLGSTPGCIIVKSISLGLGWPTYHRGMATSNPESWEMYLNTTAARTVNGTWGGAPTSTNFYVNNLAAVNQGGDSYVAYLFAHDAGGFGLTGTDNVISCGGGTFDSNGYAVVNLGYEPQWVLIKPTSYADNWYLADNMRGATAFLTSTTSSTQLLYPNLSNAETATSYGVVPNATGFTFLNGSSGSTYIYIAIRRGPMKVPTTGTSVFSPVVYTGNRSTQDLTAGFAPDLSLFETRNGAAPTWIDRLRGFTQYNTSDTTAAEATSSNSVLGMNNTQVNLGSDSALGNVNYFFVSTVAWIFRRAPSFFDEVCYTGTGANRTVTHNLGVVPELYIVKARSSVGDGDWWTYSSTLGATKYLRINLTSASGTLSSMWNNTSPTATNFSIGTYAGVNQSSSNYVAYLFATCAGVSKVGSYTGTATTKQIDCGFTAGARFVLIKRTDSTGDWYVWDTARGIIAGDDPYLLLNSATAEVTNTDYIDTYSAGFEISSTAPAAINASGGSFIFLAIS